MLRLTQARSCTSSLRARTSTARRRACFSSSSCGQAARHHAYLPGKVLWDNILLVLVLYTAFQAPFVGGFCSGGGNSVPTLPTGVLVVQWLIDVVRRALA